ncbi:Macrolide export ATP-binding/permease protein MacB [Methylobrevis pamukkalensis]|uniref:Macrolide export ATP-binding/permease protein MacB n=2 Tax=Methylobrevis pamukkalensis TaxID=1439726 RepID=A0A1E3GQ08_9HYPH|nr:Macrolide export ATP-binding/permease protein MacB [Methylobrevis pamukkalensis]
MNGGKVVLADEPTGALDSRSGEEVMALLRGMNRNGHTIIVITHAREVAEEADRVIEIRDGRIVADTRKRPAVAAPATLAGALSERRGGRLLPNVGQTVVTALRSLRANLFRTLLTLLGIAIGVGSVVAMLSIGAGTQEQVLARISSMGSNLLLVRPSLTNLRSGTTVNASLTADDARAILDLPNIAASVPENSSSLTVVAGSIDTQTTVTGTTADFTLAKTWDVERGAFITAADEADYAPVAVLGRTVAKTLFPDGDDPVGRHLLIDRIPFQVIGVMETKGATGGGRDQDDVVLVPLPTANLRLFGEDYVRAISVLVEDTAVIDATQVAVEALLTERHRRNDVMITNMSSVLDTISETAEILTLLLGAIAAISLLVGGIGVMNIMLVNVTERTREIGVRMATGASSGDLLLQFIVEALVVSLIGGAIGLALGVALGNLAGLFGITARFTLTPVVLAFGSALFTGLVFGFLPARKASRMQPAVALSAK